MKKILLGATVALLPITGFSATILGFQAGVGVWDQTPSGSIAASSGGAGTNADLANDLNLSDNSEGYSYFLVEHPVPLVPNLKYVSTTLSSSGSGATNSTFTFNGATHTATTPLNSSLKLDQTDIILYYEILDNDLVSVDVGLNAKKIDGSVSVQSVASNFSATVPMLYAYAEVGIPATDISIAGEMSTISAAGNEITDFTAKAMYSLSYGLGVEAGLRKQIVKIDIDNVKADMEFSGVFAGLYYRF